MCALKEVPQARPCDTTWLTQAAKVREVSVRKDAKTPFGAHFGPVGKFLYVIHIEKLSDMKLSAAFRAGIKFGDRLNSVNGVSVDSHTDLEELHRTLKNASSITFEIDQRPINTKFAEVHGETKFGIDFAHDSETQLAYICKVDTGSVCAQAGFHIGDVIVQVNDISVLSLPGMEITRIVTDARLGGVARRISVVAMKASLAIQLRMSCEMSMSQLGIKHLPPNIFINQSLHLDKQPDEIETVIVKENRVATFSWSNSIEQNITHAQAHSASCSSAPSTPCSRRKGHMASVSKSTPGSPVVRPRPHVHVHVPESSTDSPVVRECAPEERRKKEKKKTLRRRDLFSGLAFNL